MSNTINGRAIISTRVFTEGDYWRWIIIDDLGTEYLDGGNYLTHDQAQKGIEEALDAE